MAENRRERKKYHLKANDSAVLPIQTRVKLNPTVIMFFFIFVFLIICLVRLAFREATGYYEVVEGDNGKVSEYKAFIAREESLITADRDGYINFLVSTGERVRVTEPVCTIDESGKFAAQFLSSNDNSNTLDEASLSKVKNAMRSFAFSFDLDSYDQIYREKSILNNQLIGFLTDDMIGDISSAIDEYTFNIVNTPKSGIFTNTYDGYENFNPARFTSADIKTDDYELTRIKSSQQIKSGDAIYKLVTDDKFTIIFQMTENDIKKYWDADRLAVYFPEIDKELTGDFTFVFADDDPNTRLSKVEFKECGYLLADTRITKVRINSSVVSGLKIPETSLTTKDYYVIPKEYMTQGGNPDGESKKEVPGVNVQVYKNGTLTVKFTELSNYKVYEDYILADTALFEVGDVVISLDTGSTYEIGAQKSLKGVYNVNKGYTVFKPVNILDSMENGFVIVQKGVKGSISLYDHIALNAELIKEGELIY